MNTLARTALKTAGPWLCLCACCVGCQSLRGYGAAGPDSLVIKAQDPAQGRRAESAPPADSADTARPAAPVQVVSFQTTETPGRAAMLGNPRIGPNSALTWAVEDLPGSSGSVVSGRGTVDANGFLDLGNYGAVQVAGLTTTEAAELIKEHMRQVAAHGGRTPPSPKPAAMPPLNPVPESTATAGASGPPRPLRTAAAKPEKKSAIRQVAFQETEPTVSAEPPPVAKPAQAPPPVPSAEPLPTPRTVPGTTDPRLAPVPVDGDMDPHHHPGEATIAPRELAMASLPPYVLDPPDVLLVESTQGLRDQPIRGQHLIRPDGTISLGIYGSVHVAGMTIDQARIVIAQVLSQRIKDFDPRNLSVDVLSYNSKVYYVITDGGGYGEQVYRVPVTGNETVLDGISQINGLPAVASKRKIWLARRTPGDAGAPQVYPVNWRAITQEGISATNYQVLPGDRIYVQADCLMRIDAALAKFLSPIQRVLGTTLLGGATVNTLGGAGAGSGVAGTFIAH